MRAPQPGDDWIWVSTPRYTIAVAVAATTGGRRVVVDAPPIARWAIGKPEASVAAYFKRQPGVVITHMHRL